MNWIERLPEIKGRDFYSQNGEGLLLEYVFNQITPSWNYLADIGAGDGFILSNSKHLFNIGWRGICLDKENGNDVTAENVLEYLANDFYDLISIDIDGNDYWVIEKILTKHQPYVIIAEFNPALTDSRAIKYNPDHVWAGDDYYGFSFYAGMELAYKHGYKIIFNVANMNLIMVRKDLIEGLTVPHVTYQVNRFFKESGRPESDWVII